MSRYIYFFKKKRNLDWFVHELAYLKIPFSCDAYFSLYNHVFNAFHEFTLILNLGLAY